jgi:hypothetical protein
MIVQAPTPLIRRHPALGALGASKFESHPELLRQAEKIGNDAGIPTRCQETLDWTPGGSFYNRVCIAKCPNGQEIYGYNPDLIVESPFVFIEEVRSACKRMAAEPVTSTPLNQTPAVPGFTPNPATIPPPAPVYTPPPIPPANNTPTSSSSTQQQTQAPSSPANTPTPTPAETVQKLADTASRIWKQITAGEASGSTVTTGQSVAVAPWYEDVPGWLWIVLAAGGAYLIARKSK